ncbi:hypothetical protein SAMN05216388_1010150 [Halorientalis persicus]|uniref:Uncharacterized protein n=1 Tax=Halorientalis persicus TaxID=1367881 RepID=A0A1H8NGF0_9EURY|nr:hypothetical protein SAMN05216388_1010150 [Halorientalis persicus]
MGGVDGDHVDADGQCPRDCDGCDGHTEDECDASGHRRV